MTRKKLIELLVEKLKKLGKIIIDDLSKKFETKPVLYLAVLRSVSAEDLENTNKVFFVEIVYIPQLEEDTAIALYNKADELESLLTDFLSNDGYIRNLEVFADVLGTKSIFCNFDFVCLTNYGGYNG